MAEKVEMRGEGAPAVEPAPETEDQAYKRWWNAAVSARSIRFEIPPNFVKSVPQKEWRRLFRAGISALDAVLRRLMLSRTGEGTEAEELSTCERLRENISRLLATVGRPGTCKGCGRRIWWVETLAQKHLPITSTGLVHFADCPQADKFRRAKT